MNPLTERLSEHKAIREDLGLLGSAGPEHESKFNELVKASDRILLELAKTPCASDAEFFAKLAHIAEIEFGDCGDPEDGSDFPALAVAVRTHLMQRNAPLVAEATSIDRAIRRYCRPGALERGLKILEPGLPVLLASEPSSQPVSRRKKAP